MKKELIFLNNYSNSLLEKGKSLPDISLWYGKMGIAIYMLHFSRIVHDDTYIKEAFRLIDEVYESISFKQPIDFAHGLTGIGCGIQYSISYGFVDADSDEILSEIDTLIKNIIDSRSLNNLSLESGVCGIAYYIYSRIKNRCYDEDNIVVLRFEEYLIYLIDWMEDLILNATDINMFNDVYFILSRLHKLNVFNYKVEKLMNFSLRKLIDYNCSISDNYEFLGIDYLKILKPWIKSF